MAEATHNPPDKFSALPEELFLAILDCIEDDDTSSLYALNATSRHFQRLTTARLYYKYPGWAPEQFLRTIALPYPDGRPELAEHVKEIEWIQEDWIHFMARPQALSPEQKLLLAKQLQDSGCILNTSEYDMDLPSRFVDCDWKRKLSHWWYLEFFLLFTPKVQKLTMCDVWEWNYHYYWFQTVSMNPHRFENLSSIEIHGPLRLENVVPLLTLPSIRNLELHEVITMERQMWNFFSWGEGHGEPIVDILSGGSSLEHLALRASNIFFPEAIVILERLNKLKSLTYELAANKKASHPEAFHDFPLIEELRRLSKCPLQHLRIRSDSVLTRDVVSSLFATQVSVPEKHPLQNLRTLDIGPCDEFSFRGTSLALCGIGNMPRDPRDIAEQLPDTLEVLRIKWDYKGSDDDSQMFRLFECLGPFARAVASSSNLKRISIVDWPVLEGWIPHYEKFSSLQKLFQNLGMELNVICEEFDDISEPLVIADDVEPGWLWVRKTIFCSSFSVDSE